MKRALLNILVISTALNFWACLELEDPFVETLGAIVGTNPSSSSSAGTPMAFRAFTGNGSVLSSSDGITWTTGSISGGPDFIAQAVRIGTTLYGIDTSTDGAAWSSTDNGSTWTQITVNGSLSFSFERIAACGTTIVVGYNDTGNTELRGFVSTDSGSNWTGPFTIHATSTGALRGIACDSTRFFAAFSENPYVRYADAPYTTWTAAAPNPTSNLASTTAPMTAGNGTVIVAMAQTSPRESISTNNGAGFAGGEDFSFQFGNTNTVLGFQNSRFFVAGSGGGACSFGVSTSGGTSNWAYQRPSCTNNTIMNSIAGNGSSTVVFAGRDTVTSLPILYYSSDNAATVNLATLPSSIGTTIGTVVYIP